MKIYQTHQLHGHIFSRVSLLLVLMLMYFHCLPSSEKSLLSALGPYESFPMIDITIISLGKCEILWIHHSKFFFCQFSYPLSVLLGLKGTKLPVPSLAIGTDHLQNQIKKMSKWYEFSPKQMLAICFTTSNVLWWSKIMSCDSAKFTLLFNLVTL